MKIIYAGSPEFSIAPLKKLLENHFEVVAVLTQPDRPVGRKAILTPTPLKSYALTQNIPVYTFEKVRFAIDELKALAADCLITCAYGQILSQEVLDIFTKGVYNIHASILPRWRGASPVQHAILHGDKKTGVTIMKTDIGLDTGDIVLIKEIDIEETDTTTTLFQKLAILGADAIVEAMLKLQNGQITFKKQADEGVSLCKKIVKQECQIDFNQSASQCMRLIKAMEFSPVAYAYLQGQLVNFYDCKLPTDREDVQSLAESQAGKVVAVTKQGVFIQTGKGILQATCLQFAGSKKMQSIDIFNGKKILVNQIFNEKE